MASSVSFARGTILLEASVSDGVIVPRWLEARDAPRVEAALGAMAAFDGLTVAEVDVFARDRLEGPISQALWALERRRWDAVVEAPIAPQVVRAVVFERAATLTADEALAEASLVLGHPPEVLRGALFADRAKRRRLRAPERPSTVTDLVARYNLSLVQSLLARAMGCEASLEGDPRTIVRAARRDGLLVRARADGARVHLEVGGPLALSLGTTKYGRSIARLVPLLIGAAGWSIRAPLALGDRRAMFALSSDDAPLSASGVPPPAAAPLARRAAKALRAAGVRVDLHPEVLVARGGEVVVPDFALEWGAGHRVYVDVVPIATKEHLAAKLALQGELPAPTVLCVDERWTFGHRSPGVVPFRGAIDPWPLRGAAYHAAGVSEPAAPAPSC